MNIGKSIFAWLMIFAMLPVSAAAEGRMLPVGTGKPILIAPRPTPESRPVGGFANVVENVDAEGECYLLVETDEGETIRLNIGADTNFVNNEDGSPSKQDSIAVGERIYYYREDLTTRSIPAQSPALVICTHVDDTTAVASLLSVKGTVRTESGTDIDCGSIILHIADDVPVYALRTQQTLRALDLQAGDQILAWYDIVLYSLPAQASPSRVVLLGDAVPCATVTLRTYNGVNTVALREAAESLGFTVTWHAEEQRISLDGHGIHSTLRIGEDMYERSLADNKRSTALGTIIIDGMEQRALGLAPYAVDPGVTYVPVDYFTFLGATVALEDGRAVLTMRMEALAQ